MDPSKGRRSSVSSTTTTTGYPEEMPLSQWRVKKLFEDAMMPSRGSPEAAGFDLYLHRLIRTEGQVSYYGTGLAFEPLTPGRQCLFLFPRSSLAKTDYWLANGVGVLDRDYRGEGIIALRTYPPPFQPQPLVLGQRYTQVLALDAHALEFIASDKELTNTVRGTGGFGSTGVD